MEGSFGFPNVDKGGALFTCDFVYDIPGLAINRRSNVILCFVENNKNPGKKGKIPGFFVGFKWGRMFYFLMTTSSECTYFLNMYDNKVK